MIKKTGGELIYKGIPLSEVKTAEYLRTPFNCIDQRFGSYLLFGENDELLYVGNSNMLNARIKAHIRGETTTKHFSAQIKSVAIVDEEYEKYYDRYAIYVWETESRDLERMEEILIQKLNPKYNIQLRRKGKRA